MGSVNLNGDTLIEILSLWEVLVFFFVGGLIYNGSGKSFTRNSVVNW